MTTLERLLEQYPEEEFLIADGFNDAIIGFDEQSGRIIYSINKCIDVLMKEDMDEDEAVDYLYFNTIGSYVGDKTPIFCNDIF